MSANFYIPWPAKVATNSVALISLFLALASCSPSNNLTKCENLEAAFLSYLQIKEQAVRFQDTSQLSEIIMGDELERLQQYVTNFKDAEVIPYTEHRDIVVTVTECTDATAMTDVGYEFLTNVFVRFNGELHQDTEWHNRFATVQFEKENGKWKVSLLTFTN